MPVVTEISQTPISGSLKEIRLLFAKFSGRYDLVTASDEDNGADFFIKSGQRLLDRKLNLDRLQARYTTKLEAGQTIVRPKNLRFVNQLWVYDTTYQNKRELCQASYRQYSLLYPQDETQQETGVTSYYTPYSLRHAQDGSETLDVPASIMDVAIVEEDIDAVKVFPPSAEDQIIEVVGQFYSPTLSEDDDRNFWSIKYPEILVQAALASLEMFMRNSEGLRDQMAALDMLVMDIDKDQVEQDIVNISQIGG